MHAHKFLPVVTMVAVVAMSSNVFAADTPEEASLREALRNSSSEVSQPQALPAATEPASVEIPPPSSAGVSVPPPSASPSISAPADVSKSSVLSPIESPALPVSATKEERLTALLAKYKADEITPEEYHIQRAAILAAP